MKLTWPQNAIFDRFLSSKRAVKWKKTEIGIEVVEWEKTVVSWLNITNKIIRTGNVKLLSRAD